MLSDNKWVDEETKKIKAEQKMTRNDTWSTRYLVRFLIYMTPIFMSFVIMECPHCQQEFKTHWSSIWVCPSCGYENYEGMDYCSLCGTEKPKRTGNYFEED